MIKAADEAWSKGKDAFRRNRDREINVKNRNK